MRLASVLFSAAIVSICVACASSSTQALAGGGYSGPPIKSIAVVPGGGVLGDEIALNLNAQAFQIAPVPPDTTESALRSPDALAALRRSGIDALLVVRSVNDQYGRPRSATAVLYSTQSGALVSGVTWENGHGFGIEHSVTNSVLQVGNDQAAKEMVQTLASHIPR
jgi:hypothetical protein